MARLTRSTWIKVILISVLCVLLCGGIISCSAWSTSWRHAGNLSHLIDRGVNFTETGDITVAAKDIQSLEITWLAGAVEINVVDDDAAKNEAGELQVTAVEQFDNALRGTRPMSWQVENGTLQISYGPEAMGLASCSNVGDKRLTITLPRSLAQSLYSVDLAAASGTYELNTLKCERMNVALASGRVEGDGLSVQNLALDIASGNVELEGAFSQEVDLDMASGNVELTCSNGCPARSSLDLASGQVLLLVPANSGITAHVGKLSGSFTCELPERDHISTDTYIIGNGENSLDLSLASGNVTIRPL